MMVSSFGPQMQELHLVEDDRLLRDRHAGLGGVVGIVEPDGDQVADPADAGGRGADCRVTSGSFSIGRLADLREALGRQRVAGDVGHHLGEVADTPFGVDDSGLFAAVRAEADELHGSTLSLMD